MTFRHILFPVDFSQRSYSAAPQVESLARHYSAKTTLLHVIWHGETAKSTLTFIPAGQMLARLAAFTKDRFPSLVAACELVEGEPAQAIVKFAREKGVDLIMLPSHGYGPFRSLLIGSVTAKVLHIAQCPVWTGAHVESEPQPMHTPFRSVLCAVDLTPHTGSLME
ncbi:MAG TPA: universal stress protein [Bryobacteraceae bacterium]|nr:universal stress protein [Bryobacteraceae bacterium]